MPRAKYLIQRGKTWQFVRRVPGDVVETVGVVAWRESLGTDSLTEAERLLRIKLVETDKIIEDARSGKFRRFSEDDLDRMAIDWSLWFEERVQTTMPMALLGSRFRDLIDPSTIITDDEITNPIISNRDQLTVLVKSFLQDSKIPMRIPSPDWEKLLDNCQDEYYHGNPEIPRNVYIRSLG